MSQQPQQQHLARTRQDLINSGDLFRMNEKFAQEERERNQQMSSRLKTNGRSSGASECCYSICNLILIIATVISLFILIRFHQDEPLYEYGEYLLGLAFYRQLIYLLCLMPLILLLPIWNALSALVFSLSGSNSDADHNAPGRSKSPGGGGGRRAMLKLRLAYQVVLFALTLLGLVFMAPYISKSSVASQIEFEFRRMLKMRFESNFHYELLDSIQETYECCDGLWYRANLQDGIPLTCFKPGTNFTLVYGDTCPEVLGLLVSIRCAILAACLLASLVALACLFAVDCEQLLSGSRTRGAYEIAPNLGAGAGATGLLGAKNARDSNAIARTSDPVRRQQADCAQDGDRESMSSSGGGRGLQELEEEAERELPLLIASQAADDDNDDESIRDEDEDEDDETSPPSPREANGAQSRRSRFLQEQDTRRQDSPIVLTRADYKTIVRQRSQSPVFLSSVPQTTTTTSGLQPVKPPASQPIKSALKSGSSQQNVSSELETGGHHQYNGGFGTYRQRDDQDEDDDSLISDYTERLRKSDSLLRQKQLQRRDQLRKSLQSVRFADENP